MLNIKQLQVLHEVARHGTLAQAAAALHVTPPSVSQQLTALQRETGIELLERAGRGVRLTPAALQLVEHARVILDQLTLAESDLAAFHGAPRGRIRVAAFHTVLLELAPLTLTAVMQRYPDLEVQFINQDMDQGQAGLLSHDFDLVLGEQYPGAMAPQQPGVHREDLGADLLKLVVPEHGLLSGASGTPLHPRTLADLAQAPWAMEPDGTRIQRWTVNRCREAGFEPRVRAETPDRLLNLQLVRHGHAVAIVPALLSDTHFSGVLTLDLPELPHRTLFTEVRSGRERHPAITAIRSALQEAYDAITSREHTQPH